MKKQFKRTGYQRYVILLLITVFVEIMLITVYGKPVNKISYQKHDIPEKIDNTGNGMCNKNTGTVSIGGKVDKTAESTGSNDNNSEKKVSSVQHDKFNLVVLNKDYIDLYSTLGKDKELLTRISRKDWGTWNVHGWFICSDGKIPSKCLTKLAGGGTDWEYVYRVSDNPALGYVFSGGNHGYECLKSIGMFDDKTKTEFKIASGDTIKQSCESFTIIEETFLTSNSDPASKYADVTRIYTVTPAQILLETKYEFTRDIYMGTSYVCMLPVPKLYGNHVKFEDTGKVYDTPNTGTSLTVAGKPNYLGMDATLSTLAYSEKNPMYSIKTWVGDKEMVDNFANQLKVFYWDVNQWDNKLYFSKYDNDKPLKIMAGTRWDYTAGWKLLYGDKRK